MEVEWILFFEEKKLNILHKTPVEKESMVGLSILKVRFSGLYIKYH